MSDVVVHPRVKQDLEDCYARLEAWDGDPLEKYIVERTLVWAENFVSDPLIKFVPSVEQLRRFFPMHEGVGRDV